MLSVKLMGTGDGSFPYDLKAFGERLRTLRRRRAWSQQELAEKAHTNDDNISAYERGARGPKFETLDFLAHALELTRDELVHGLPERKSEKNVSGSERETRGKPDANAVYVGQATSSVVAVNVTVGDPPSQPTTLDGQVRVDVAANSIVSINANFSHVPSILKIDGCDEDDDNDE
jgi:transcriptional regulator with XRE-family HTH domain